MKCEIKKNILDLPKSPGVYQFLDHTGDILYVGKAKNLKNRLKSYMAKNVGRGPGIDAMIDLACEVRYIETESEIEAVILEANLINALKPKYNIRLRDDKSFLMIKIAKPLKLGFEMESFPVVELSRYKNLNLKDKAFENFGPYPSGDLVRRSVRVLRKIFPFRDCSKTKFYGYRKKNRPCIYGDIGVCTAPCVLRVNELEYYQNIRYLKNFLKGRKKEVIKEITKSMNCYSRKKLFESAAMERNKLLGLYHIKDVAIGLRDEIADITLSMFNRIECYDISNIMGEYATGSMIVFENGKKATSEYKRFKIKSVTGANDLLMLREVLLRRMKNDWPPPDMVVIDGGELHKEAAREVLTLGGWKDTPIVSIAKGAKRKKNEFHFSRPSIAKIVMANQQLQNIIIQTRDEAHRFAISYYRKLHLKDTIES